MPPADDSNTPASSQERNRAATQRSTRQRRLRPAYGASASSREDRTALPAEEIPHPAPTGWQDITDELLERTERAGPHGPGAGLTRRLAWEWALVLEARDIPYRMERSNGYRLLALGRDVSRLAGEIDAYERENAHTPLPSSEAAMRENSGYTVGVMLLLGLFHGISQNQWRLFGHDAASAPIPWLQRGANDCFEVMYHGAWWRSITALTLHGDAAHVVSNMGIGLLVMLPLCRELGGGAGWLLPLLAGALGNLLNCQLQGTGHLSVGASTAVFGAVGVLCALRAAREHSFSPRAVLLPLGAGLTLLAFLGMGQDPQTDVGAHLCGFAAGLLFGAGAGLAVRRFGPPGARLSLVSGALASVLVVAAWALALAQS